VNSLRAGYPVRTYAEFKKSAVILLCLPDTTLPDLINEMSLSEFDWTGKVILLCDSVLDNGSLSKLAERGASVGSLNEVPGFDGDCFVAEGDRPAVLAARRLLSRGHARVMELKSSEKATFLAGVTFAGELVTPLAHSAVSSFRLAGLHGEQAAIVLERIFERALRSYLKAGKSGWTGHIASGNLDEVLRQIEKLRQSSPALSDFLRSNAAAALAVFGRDPAVLLTK
jgi:predicted short-subunit dehydrogenase-like oxidoreductase (DUF2520 family)